MKDCTPFCIRELHQTRHSPKCPNNNIEYVYRLFDKACVLDILPNEVLFAMGNEDKIECASKWINRLQKEIEELRNGHKGACPTCEPVGELNKKLEKENELLRSELEKEREVVEFYGDSKKWEEIEVHGQIFDLEDSDICDAFAPDYERNCADSGNRARQRIKERKDI